MDNMRIYSDFYTVYGQQAGTLYNVDGEYFDTIDEVIAYIMDIADYYDDYELDKLYTDMELMEDGDILYYDNICIEMEVHDID